MKPRVIATYKVLAVALATVSCGKTPTADPQSQQGPTSQQASAAPQAVPAAAPNPASIVSDDKADPKLLLLRTELDGETSESALAKQAHYRPLCDKDGYPLVGNVVRKGRGGPHPSQLCADVRAKKATPS